MNDWLSEIEEYVQENRELLEGLLDENDMMRLARVLRELVEQIKEARNIANDTPEEAAPQVLDDALTNIVVALRDEWSPDAKELLK